MKFNRINQKGQAFAGYRLIIGALIAFFILLIILGAINYFESIKTRTTHDSLRSGLNAAKETPDGSIIKKKAVYFSAGSAYTKQFFSIQSGVPAACLQLIADKPTVKVTENSISFEQALTIDVFFRCVLLGSEMEAMLPFVTNECRDVSDLYCQISVGDETFGST